MKTKLILFALSVAMVSPLIAGEPNAKRLAQLPVAVRQTTQALVGDGRLMDIERTMENGRPVFEGEFRRDGVTRGFTLAADGMLISKQVFEKELPSAVAQTLRAQLADAQLGEIYWTNDDGDPAYAVEFTRGGAKRSLTIAPDGWLSAREIAVADLPNEVRRAVEAELKGATPTHVERTDDGAEVTFDVTIEAAKRPRTLIFNERGALTATEIPSLEMPAEVQKTIQPRLIGARLIHVFKAEEDGDTYFEATYVKGGLKHTATALADGTLVSVQLPLTEVPATVQKAIREQKAFVVRLEQIFEDGESSFEVLLRSRGKITKLELKPDGSAK